MDNQPATTSTSARSRLVRLWPWLVVLAVLLFVGFIRVRLLEMPLERDEGEYAYAGQLILQGVPPYELAYSMKLPGTYFAYAAGMALFGQSISGIHLTLLLVNSLTIVFVFLLGRELFGVTAGLVASASYGIMSVDPAVFGMAAHATQFVALFAVPGTLLLWKAGKENRYWSLFFSGLLYGLAFLMKQQGVYFGLFGCSYLIWLALGNRSVFSAEFVKRSMVFGVGMVLPFGLTCLYLAWAGVFAKFWFWTFAYASSYVTSVSLWDGIRLFSKYLKETIDVYFGFWTLAIVGLLLALRKKAIRNQVVFIVFFSFFSFFSTATGFYFREHYFVLLLPAFAVIVGLAFCSLEQTLQSGIFRFVPLTLFAAILGWNIWASNGLFFQLSPSQANQVIYMGNPFIETLAVGKYIREHSAENARIAVIGSEPEIYFYAQRRSATGYIYTYPLMENKPYVVVMQRQMISEIESVKPNYLVLVVNRLSWSCRNSSDMEIFDWAQKYTAEYYDCVGVLSCPLGAPNTEVWGSEAKNYIKLLKQYVVVCQRKPQPD